MSAPEVLNNSFDIRLKHRETSYGIRVGQPETSFNVSLPLSERYSNIVVLNLINAYADLGDLALFVPRGSSKLITADDLIFACETYLPIIADGQINLGASAMISMDNIVNLNGSVPVCATAKISGASSLLSIPKGIIGLGSDAIPTIFGLTRLAELNGKTLNDINDMTLLELYHTERK